MKTLHKGAATVTAFLFAVISAPAFAADDGDGKLLLQMNENRGSWSANSSSKKEGGQNYLYFSAGYYTPNYGITALGAHGDTAYRYNSPAKNDFSLASFTDSTVSLYYLPAPVAGANIRLGADFNIPTGHARFSGRELASLMIDNVSKELNIFSSYGKGFNIAPNVALSAPYAKGSFGLGVRYELTGEYDPTSDVADDSYNPGNILMIFGSLQYNFTEAKSLYLDVSTTMVGKDTQGGAEVFKQGNAYSLTARYVTLEEKNRATYGLTYGWQENNQMYGAGGLTTEDRNTNNNYYDLFINAAHHVDPSLALNGIAGYKSVKPNSYDEANALHDGGFGKIYFGGGATQYFSKQMYATFDLRFFQIWNANDALEPGGAVYRGINVDIGVVYAFGGG